MDSPTLFDAPELPYAGTSGWSGSSTSRERAMRADSDGTTSERQLLVLSLLAKRGASGLTWREVSVLTDWHHGTASGVLSVLHKAERIARLTERRGKCLIYVLPEHVNGRETQKQNAKASARDLIALLAQVEDDLHHGRVTLALSRIQQFREASNE